MPIAASQQHRRTSRLLPRRHYSKPPIVETVIDLQVERSPRLDVSRLVRVREGYESRFPQVNQLTESSVTFDVATGAEQHSVEHQATGVQLVAGDRSEAVMLRSGGFTYSKLPPYTRWEMVYTSARDLWERYLEVARPASVKRLAVRYINRIDIPYPGPPVRAYFHAFPELGPFLQQPVAEYTMRLVVPQIDMPGVTLVLGQGRVLNPAPDRISIMLDIDLFVEADLPPESEQIWGALQLLHDRENEVFEGSITDLARGLFS